jgi:hypothetical protein
MEREKSPNMKKGFSFRFIRNVEESGSQKTVALISGMPEVARDITTKLIFPYLSGST